MGHPELNQDLSIWSRMVYRLGPPLSPCVVPKVDSSKLVGKWRNGQKDESDAVDHELAGTNESASSEGAGWHVSAGVETSCSRAEENDRSQSVEEILEMVQVLGRATHHLESILVESGCHGKNGSTQSHAFEWSLVFPESG